MIVLLAWAAGAVVARFVIPGDGNYIDSKGRAVYSLAWPFFTGAAVMVGVGEKFSNLSMPEVPRG